MSLFFGLIQQDSVNTLEVSTSEMYYTFSGGTQSFNITSNISWSISSDFWIELDKTVGSGNDTIYVTVAETEIERWGQIEISGSGITRYIDVYQTNT